MPPVVTAFVKDIGNGVVCRRVVHELVSGGSSVGVDAATEVARDIVEKMISLVADK